MMKLENLITENEDGVLLSSYEIPEGEDRNAFSYASMKNVDYSKLKKSEKFTPALYREKDGIWEGGSTSRFSPVMIKAQGNTTNMLAMAVFAGSMILLYGASTAYHSISRVSETVVRIFRKIDHMMIFVLIAGS